MDLKLTNKTALITGASKGIGLAVAELFAAEGCHLHLAARNGEAMLLAKRQLESRHGVKITIHALDLSSTAAMESTESGKRRFRYRAAFGLYRTIIFLRVRTCVGNGGGLRS